MVNMPFSCKGCEKRTPGCHSICEKYRSERAEYDRLKAKANDEKIRWAHTASMVAIEKDRHAKRRKATRGYNHVHY